MFFPRWINVNVIEEKSHGKNKIPKDSEMPAEIDAKRQESATERV